jgi:hypothetical protein
MQPSDAATAIAVVCVGCLVVVAILAFVLTVMAHAESDAPSVIAAEDAARVQPIKAPK